ncbi:unnamed protein product [Cochlearia groenlandica]
MIPMDNHFVPTNSTTGLVVFPASYGLNAMNSASVSQPRLDSSSASVSGVKSEAALVMDWSVEEQYVLENGLAKLKDEPQISKYAKIAATLPDKTVRDVALRCRWMTRKRRKREDNSARKNIGNRKPSFSSLLFSWVCMVFKRNRSVLSVRLPLLKLFFSGLSELVMNLLQQNTRAFSQISYNLSACQLQDNTSLFYEARNNINAILTDMKEMPGIMSRMPPLPISINDDLVSRLLSSTPQPLSYTIPPSIHLKQEPRS